MSKKQNAVGLSVRIPYLILGVVCMLFAGIIYAWSILKVPLSAEFGWTASQLALNFTLMMCFFCIGGLISGLLTKRTSPRCTMVISAALVCSGFVIASLLAQESLFLLYVSYSFLSGLGIGMAYNAIIVAISAWFPDKKAFCSGALMMGFGASTLLLGNIANSLIQSPGVGWRTTYVILGAAIGVVLLITAFVIKLPPKEIEFPPPVVRKKSTGCEQFEPRDFTAGEMLRRFSFWRFFLFSIALAAVGNATISFARDVAIAAGSESALATTLVGVLAVCNGLGRITSGLVFDYLGRKCAMLVSCILDILAPIILIGALWLQSVLLCVAGLCIMGLAYGFSPNITSAFTAAFYGTKNYGLNFSITNLMLIPTSFAATAASALVASTGTYIAPMLMLLGCAVVALLLNFTIRKP